MPGRDPNSKRNEAEKHEKSVPIWGNFEGIASKMEASPLLGWLARGHLRIESIFNGTT